MRYTLRKHNSQQQGELLFINSFDMYGILSTPSFHWLPFLVRECEEVPEEFRVFDEVPLVHVKDRILDLKQWKNRCSCQINRQMCSSMGAVDGQKTYQQIKIIYRKRRADLILCIRSRSRDLTTLGCYRKHRSVRICGGLSA